MLTQSPNKKQYLEHLVQNIPRKPGVYKMKDQEGRIIYVGKAKDLRNRVSSYFKNGNDKGQRTLKMVEQISDFEYIVVGTELEALLLETNLIKELRPKYNVLMKDDKSYVYIKITIHEPYPRIYLVRKPIRDKARYFGPKTAAHKVIKTLKILKRIFPFRNCPLAIDYNIHADTKGEKAMSPSQLEYHVKHCIGPCVASVTSEEYRTMIHQVIDFLEGKHEEIIEKIKGDMLRAAAEKKFEVAAAIRDKLKAVEEITETQRISDPHQKDLDIINYAEMDDKIYFNLFQLRNGKLIDQENFIFKTISDHEKEDKDALTAFLEQYYEKATDIPKEILIPHEIEEPEAVSSWLAELKGSKVQLVIPERGKKNHLLELSHANAQSFARQSLVKWQGAERGNRQGALEGLQEVLKLQKPPVRLECYDISHFGGTETVSSMVVFEKGFPKKEDYRHFKLHQQTSGEPNDFASMQETLERRLKYLKPSVASAEFSLRKAKKKDLLALTEKRKKELASNTFYIVEKNKKNIGSIEITVTPTKKILVESLVLDEPLDLHTVIKKIVEKCKAVRLYLAVVKKEQARYEEAGCQAIKKIPDGIEVREEFTILTYDRTKYAEDTSFKKIPDLIIIDGGKGQLSSACKALEKYKLNLPIISIAKREEEIFLPKNPQPIVLTKDNPILHLIQHIRNEAHRFAITYHQNLRLKATTNSILDTIPGLGPELKKKLLTHFGSPEGVKQATMHELAQVIGNKLAQRIKERIQ